MGLLFLLSWARVRRVAFCGVLFRCDVMYVGWFGVSNFVVVLLLRYLLTIVVCMCFMFVFICLGSKVSTRISGFMFICILLGMV